MPMPSWGTESRPRTVPSLRSKESLQVNEPSAQGVYAVADEVFRVMESGDVAAFLALLAPEALFFSSQ